MKIFRNFLGQTPWSPKAEYRYVFIDNEGTLTKSITEPLRSTVTSKWHCAMDGRYLAQSSISDTECATLIELLSVENISMDDLTDTCVDVLALYDKIVASLPQNGEPRFLITDIEDFWDTCISEGFKYLAIQPDGSGLLSATACHKSKITGEWYVPWNVLSRKLSRAYMEQIKAMVDYPDFVGGAGSVLIRNEKYHK